MGEGTERRVGSQRRQGKEMSGGDTAKGMGKGRSTTRTITELASK
ncbi:MAG TPA: hypothetical protein VN726_17950 [Hanamia sp.]|nr:hypothetical protein [Hanamia sp.]